MKTENEGNVYGWASADRTDAHAYILPAIIKLLPDSKKLNILDAGCGNGYVAGKLAALGHHVVGIDQAEDGIAIAQATYPNLNFEVRSVYDDLKGLMTDVDLVISSEVIEHLFYPQRFIRNLYDVIRPGGHIILTTPYHGYLKNLLIGMFGLWDQHHTIDWEGGHIKFFSKKSLSRLLRSNGFVEIVYRNAGRIPFLWKSMVCRAKGRGYA